MMRAAGETTRRVCRGVEFRSRQEQQLGLFPTEQGQRQLDHLGRRLCGRRGARGGLGHDCAAVRERRELSADSGRRGSIRFRSRGPVLGLIE